MKRLFGNDILKYIIILLSVGFISSCSSSSSFERYENDQGNLIETGIASWYGPKFHRKRTANGETYNMNEFTAAHKTLPFNTILRVVNRRNNKSVIVRINDRGPYAKSRIIDLSKKAAEEIDMILEGSTEVNLYLLSDTTLPQNLKKESFTVQVGSFRKLRDAEKFSDQVPGSNIVKVNLNGDDYYRVFSGLFYSKFEAGQHLKFLEDSGFDGLVKQIEN